MKPIKGQHIHILFKNGTNINGIVELWSDKESHLKSISGNNDIIIFNTIENVMMVILNKEKQAEEKKELSKKFEATYNAPSDDDLRNKNLADLKNLLNQQEKEIIIEKLSSHHITDVAGVKYGVPGFFKKQGS
jgi:hypothetical protein